MNRSTTVSYSGSFDDSSTAHLDLSNRKKLPKGKVIRSTMVAPARLKEEEVSNNEKEKIEWKNETNSNWVVIKKNKNILVKLNFILDRSCKVKQDLRAKKNVLMSELRKVPGLIIDELINYYYEPHQHDLTTEIEDFDLYERMKTFQMQDNHRGYYKNVVNELIASEKTYIQGLDIILSVYLDTLIAASKKGAKDLVTIREQISSIHQRHQEFLSNLNRALITNPECPLIGDIIVNFSPSLESCAEYIFNYPTYLEQVTSMMTESNLALTIQHIQQYLITPIQRTPRYVLLITDLLRNISMSFGDAPKLIEAHRAIKRVATTINAKGHEYEADEN
ncbi:Rho/RAC guanine nucleotide exchange factor [Entamoeba marina]